MQVTEVSRGWGNRSPRWASVVSSLKWRKCDTQVKGEFVLSFWGSRGPVLRDPCG